MAEHPLGSTTRLRTEVRQGAVLVNPSSITLTVTKPDTTLATPTVQTEGVGLFYGDVLLDQRGAWPWEWEANGPDQVESGVELVTAALSAQAPGWLLARERLRIMAAADEDPTLSDYELELAVDLARRPDRDGRGMDEAAWIPTFAYGIGAAELWTWKAGKVANRVDLADEAAKLTRSQLQAQFLKMAAEHRKRPMSAVCLYRPGRIRDAGILEGWEALLPGAQGPVHLGPPYESPLALPGASARGDNTA